MSLLLLAAAIIPAGQSFPCTPTAVYDGDGPIWCAEGPRIRLAGIAAREMDGTCRDNQPCPNVSAERSRDELVKLLGAPIGRGREGHVLVRGAKMRCRSVGSAGGSRTAAWCVSPRGGDLSCAMVRGGWALRWARYWHSRRCRKFSRLVADGMRLSSRRPNPTKGLMGCDDLSGTTHRSRVYGWHRMAICHTKAVDSWERPL